jgi:NAD(P)-dependent dehydrogenase (short-subunit alcohol dehydrogenase family)
LKADGRFNNAGIAGEGSREGYEKSDDVEKFSQQLLKSEFKEWDDILRTNVTAHYVRLSSPTSYLDPQPLHSSLISSKPSVLSRYRLKDTQRETLVNAQFTAASFLPLLKKGGDNTKDYASQIINTTSISGLLKGSSGGQFAYASSKASMVQVSLSSCRIIEVM